MRYGLFALAICSVHLVEGQNVLLLDSLRSAIGRSHQDSTRVDLLLTMAGELLSSDADSALAICERAAYHAARSARREDVGEVQGWLGYIQEQRGRIEEAIGHYEQSLKAAEAFGDRTGIATVLNNLAAIYKDQGRIDEALNAHQRSLSIRRTLKDTSAIANSLNNIGLIKYDQGRIADAVDHYAEALELYETIGAEDGMATVLHNMAGVYRDQGEFDEARAYFDRALLIERAANDLYGAASTEDNIGGLLEAQDDTDEALVHYTIALALHDSVGDVRGEGYSLRNIAGVELQRGNAQAALVYAEEALQRFLSSDDKRGQASALLMKGLALEQTGRPAEALLQGHAALALSKELGYPGSMRDAAQLLLRLHRSAGRWQEALPMYDLYITMRDSVLNQDARKSAIKQQYRYAYEKKEAAMKTAEAQRELIARERLQKERNRRNIILFSGLGVLLAAIALWSRLRYVHRSRALIRVEKEVSEKLLLNILPQQVAEELKLNGEAEARHLESVTVLFTDFKGFTAMSERLTPKELVKEIHECFSAFDRIVEGHGLEKIKTIGDAYMAAGGLPTPNATHPADVINAALEMRDRIAACKALKVRQGLPFFEIRIGVHTGPVVAGIVGLKKFQYDIWGDTVNVASRMESSGEVGKVNISHASYSLLRQLASDRFAFTPRGNVHTKGKGEMEMWFVERQATEPLSG